MICSARLCTLFIVLVTIQLAVAALAIPANKRKHHKDSTTHDAGGVAGVPASTVVSPVQPKTVVRVARQLGGGVASAVSNAVNGGYGGYGGGYPGGYGGGYGYPGGYGGGYGGGGGIANAQSNAFNAG